MKRSKYGNVRTVIDGHSFASKAEGRRYAELKLLERAGKIKYLELQPKLPLTVNNVLVCKYVGDFRFLDLETNGWVIEDVKGRKTRDYRIKAKLVHAVYGFKVVEIAA